MVSSAIDDFLPSPWGLSMNAKTPFDKLRVSGRAPFKSNSSTAQAELVEASFRRSTVPAAGAGAIGGVTA
jgi:hypothetical protein